MFRMSSSVKAGLWRLSKLYSFIKICRDSTKQCLIEDPSVHYHTDICYNGKINKSITWMPVLMEISLRSVIFCRPYFSTAWSTLSLPKQAQRTKLHTLHFYLVLVRIFKCLGFIRFKCNLCNACSLKIAINMLQINLFSKWPH